MTSSSIHNPVMLEEALDLLNVEKGKCFLDATVGLGGHAEAILGASDPNGRLLGTDADPDALAQSANRLLRFGDRVQLRRAWLDAAPRVATDAGLTPFDGVLCDLGLSSLQLDSADRGFSFQAEGPLDMRLGPSDDVQTVSAHEIVNEWTADELASLIYDYGEERRSRRIARSIVRQRPVETTTQLAQCVVDAVGIRPGSRVHPATRVFQAIRLEVNRELERLAAFLAQVRDLLRTGGRLVVIAFHSLEDRIVKQFLREQSSGSEPAFRTLTRRVMRPSRTESERNPRARSARLRAAEAI